MARATKDLLGHIFGRLSVIGRAPPAADRSATQWLCRCECSKEKIILAKSLISGTSKSCGCMRVKARHGVFHRLSRTTEYQIWKGMKARCEKPKNRAFKNYGGRGIKLCQRWSESFEAFLEDMGSRPPGLTIERKDNDGDYDPSNCKWATWDEQAANRRPKGTANRGFIR